MATATLPPNTRVWTDRPNRYPADCVRCHQRIAAGDGNLARTATGFAADHRGTCPAPTTPVAPAAPRELVNTDGIYRAPDGTLYKVQEARQGNGRLYAKRLTIRPCGDPACGHPTTVDDQGRHHHGHFEYAPGLVNTLTPAMRLTDEQAAAYGVLYGICVCCGADLTDENSIARGLGPICAGKYF